MRRANVERGSERPAPQLRPCGSLGHQVGDDIAQAVPAGQVRHAEGDELRPAARPPKRLALMVRARQALKLMARHPFQQLSQDGRMVSQGSILLWLAMS